MLENKKLTEKLQKHLKSLYINLIKTSSKNVYPSNPTDVYHPPPLRYY